MVSVWFVVGAFLLVLVSAKLYAMAAWTRCKKRWCWGKLRNFTTEELMERYNEAMLSEAPIHDLNKSSIMSVFEGVPLKCVKCGTEHIYRG